MTFTNVDRKDVAEIINSSIEEANFQFDIPRLDPEDISPTLNTLPGLITLMPGSKNPVSHIFQKLAHNRQNDFGEFHHFKSTGIALSIITSKSIQVSNLLSNDRNDFAEFSEFYKRAGLINLFIPDNYCDATIKKRIDPSSPSQIDRDRDSVFILCFTQDNHNEKFWEKYANQDEGVAIGFRFERFSSDHWYKYDFRDVTYDSGYMFEFMNKMNYLLKKKYGSFFLAEGITKFSKFYKRGAYNWENETRLSFHYDLNPMQYGEELNSYFPIQEDTTTGRKYVVLPLAGNTTPNPLFELTIAEVVCGSKVAETDFDKLRNALKANFPHAIIWQRKNNS